MIHDLIIFDIETIPDLESARILLDAEGASDDEISEMLINYHLEITGGKNAFIRQLFHKVVAISYVNAKLISLNGDIFYQTVHVKSGGNIKSNEADLVAGFFAMLEKIEPKLISFNGKTFDIPVLQYRAMKHSIVAPKFFDDSDKWETRTHNYNSRYSKWNVDLLDELSSFGASARIKLSEVCALLKFPGKIGVDGSKVFDMYKNNEIDAIRNYCESDVINTYLVFLKNELLRGKIDKTGYKLSIDDLLTYLKKENKKHFEEFLQAWQQINKGDFYS